MLVDKSLLSQKIKLNLKITFYFQQKRGGWCKHEYAKRNSLDINYNKNPETPYFYTNQQPSVHTKPNAIPLTEMALRAMSTRVQVKRYAV